MEPERAQVLRPGGAPEAGKLAASLGAPDSRSGQREGAGSGGRHASTCLQVPGESDRDRQRHLVEQEPEATQKSHVHLGDHTVFTTLKTLFIISKTARCLKRFWSFLPLPSPPALLIPSWTH